MSPTHSRPLRYKRRLFGLRSNPKRSLGQRGSRGAEGKTHNYAKKYWEDPYGEEAFPEARVWKVYNREAGIIDAERIEAWRDALDVQLVLIALFSAIVSTFLVQTSETLQPDYSRISAILLWEVLQAIANNSSINPSGVSSNVPDPRSAIGTPTNTDIMVDILWFTSLAISLSAGLFTGLVKQWLYHYTATISADSSRQRARNRQFRDDGLKRYRVAVIINLLPVALSAALALFLAGLVIFLYPLCTTLFHIVLGIAGSAYIFYIISAFLPIIDPQCPYHAPITPYLYILTRYPVAVGARRARWVYRGIVWLCRTVIQEKATSPPTYTSPPSSLGEVEKIVVAKSCAQLDLNGVVWLYQASANPNVRSIALEAFGGLAPSNANASGLHKILDSDLYTALRQCSDPGNVHPTPLAGMERRHDRLVRAVFVGARLNVEWPTGLFVKDTPELHQDPTQRLRIFPWLERCWWGSDLAALFPLFQPDISFPLPVWAAVLRLAHRHQPDHQVIRIGIITSSVFHSTPSTDNSDMGNVTFETAVSNSFVRSLALDYLGITHITPEGALWQVHSSLSSLISTENQPKADLERTNRCFTLLARHSFGHQSSSPLISVLSLLVSSLFQLVVDQTRKPGRSDEVVNLTHNIIHMFLQSSYADQVTWETLFHATNAWNRSPRHAITTPLMICRILEQFRRPSVSEAKDIEWIRKTVGNLEDILYEGLVSHPLHLSKPMGNGIRELHLPGKVLCNGSSQLDLANTICCRIRELNLLPLDIGSRSDSAYARLLWSPGMIRKVIAGTWQLQESQQGRNWFDDWLAYLHITPRLVFFCKSMISMFVWRNDPILKLCLLEPKHAQWRGCLMELLALFEDEAYLDSLVDDDGNRIERPHQLLAQRLTSMKGILQNHHHLSGPAYDIPQLDSKGSRNRRIVVEQESSGIS